MAIVAPITSAIRGIKLEVSLTSETKPAGAILVFQLKSIDFIQRNAEFIEKTPTNIIEPVSAIAQILAQ